MIELVVGPDDPEAARWAARLSLPAGGRLAAVVPVGGASLGAVEREILGALGIALAPNPHWRSATESTVYAASWLRARRIDRLILVHADWLTPSLVTDLGAFAALAGIDVTCLVRPSMARRYAGWAGRERSWPEFAADEARAETVRLALAADPSHHLRAPIGPLGLPAGSVAVRAALAPEGEAAAAYLDLAGRVRREGRSSRILARSLARVLRTFPPGASRTAALTGAARAIDGAAYRLWTDPGRWPDLAPRSGGPAGPRWLDLAGSLHPHGPAAVALLAAELWAGDTAKVAVGGVSPDGATVRLGGRDVAIQPAARAFLVAERFVRLADGARPDEPFLAHRGRALTAGGIARTAAAVLEAVGLVVRPADLVAPRSPSVRWLAEQGLVLRPQATPGATTLVKARCCRHGLPDRLRVEGIVLSHSQRLCLTVGAADDVPSVARPADAGYTVRLARRTRLGSVHAVSRDGEPAGELIGLETPDGPLWLQMGGGSAPSLEAIVERVRLDYPDLLGQRERS